jgi:hypothetical protein
VQPDYSLRGAIGNANAISAPPVEINLQAATTYNLTIECDARKFGGNRTSTSRRPFIQ